MGTVGSSGANAAVESFFALMQENVLDSRTCRIREQLRIAIVTWIKRSFRRRRRRRQALLGRLTPIEFETLINPTVALAAWLHAYHRLVQNFRRVAEAEGAALVLESPIDGLHRSAGRAGPSTAARTSLARSVRVRPSVRSSVR